MQIKVAYRDFFLLHILRELSPKYRILWVGLLWTLGQPILSSFAVAYFVGPRLVERLVTQQYFFYCWTGFSIWFFFSQSIQSACSTLNQKMKLVRSSNVPNTYLAASPTMAGLLELALNLLVILIVAVPIWGPGIDFKTPFFILAAFVVAGLFSFGVAFWASSLCLLYQDLKYLISFLLQLGFLCTPIIYSPRISGWKAALYYSNPLALSIKLTRLGLGISTELSSVEFLGGSGIALATLLSGYSFFRTQSKMFPELV